MNIAHEARLVVGFKLNHPQLLELMRTILIKHDLWNNHDTAGSLIQLTHNRLFNMAIEHMNIVATDFESEFPLLAKQSRKIEYYCDENGTEFGISFICSYSPVDVIKLINYSRKSLRHLFNIYGCSTYFDEELIKIFPVVYSY